MLGILKFFLSVFVDFFSFVFSGVGQHFSKFIEWLSHPSLSFFEDGHLSTTALAILFIVLLFIALIMEFSRTVWIFSLFIIIHFAIMVIGALLFRERYSAFMGMKPSELPFVIICGGIVPMLIGGAGMGSYLGIGGVSALFTLLAYIFRLTGLVTVTQFIEMTNLSFDMVTVYAIPFFILCKVLFMEIDDQDYHYIIFFE